MGGQALIWWESKQKRKFQLTYFVVFHPLLWHSHQILVINSQTSFLYLEEMNDATEYLFNQLLLLRGWDDLSLVIGSEFNYWRSSFSVTDSPISIQLLHQFGSKEPQVSCFDLRVVADSNHIQSIQAILSHVFTFREVPCTVKGFFCITFDASGSA